MLYGTGRVVLLVHCIVLTVPVSPQNPKDDLKYQIAKMHSAPKPDVTFKCKLCYQEFPGFYALVQHRNTQNGMQIGSGTRDVDVEHIVGDFENHRLREELHSCQQFLVDSDFERASNKVFIFNVENLNAEHFDEKFDHFFNNLKCAAKVSLAFGFILREIEDGGFNIFMHTKTIPRWIGTNLSLPVTTWQN